MLSKSPKHSLPAFQTLQSGFLNTVLSLKSRSPTVQDSSRSSRTDQLLGFLFCMI